MTKNKKNWCLKWKQLQYLINSQSIFEFFLWSISGFSRENVIWNIAYVEK